MIPTAFGGAARLRLSSAVKIIVDGNSIYYGTGSNPFDQVLALDPYLSGSGVTYANVAASGQTWAQMTSSATDVNAAFDASKTNVLICAETTNAARGGKIGSSIYDDAAAYIAARRAHYATISPTKPLRIIVCSSLPMDGSASNANAYASAADALMRANFRAMGADAFCDYRTGSSPFNHDGTSAAVFQAQQSLWLETSSWLHPLTAGVTIMCQMVANTLRRLKA